MKIQCDFCTKQEATVFCLADEAALCNVCDQRVHQANKLASRHKRFSLLDPSPSHMPFCDICQERKALLFSQQDRAILCRDCDPKTHQENEHTQTHNRFLLVGINSPPPRLSPSKLEPECYNMVNDMKHTTISEYLTKILPGWKVEDLLDSIATPPRVSESMDNYVAVHGGVSSFANNGIRVPEAAKFCSFQDQRRALPRKMDLDSQRKKMNTEKLIGSQMKSSLFQKSDPCVGFKRKKPLL